MPQNALIINFNGGKPLALEFYLKYQVQVTGVKRGIQAVHKSRQVSLKLPWHWPPSPEPLKLGWVPEARVLSWRKSTCQNSSREGRAVSDGKIFGKKLRPEWQNGSGLTRQRICLSVVALFLLQPKKGKKKRTNEKVGKPGEGRLPTPPRVSPPRAGPTTTLPSLQMSL